MIAICSMLHEESNGSATLRFRDKPVLKWTVDRLRRAEHVSDVVVLCWEDQVAAANQIGDARIISRGARSPSASMQAIAAARRWSDGWRGGLLQTCDFDAGFDSAATLDAMAENQAAVSVDPSSALVDPKLIDALIEHAERSPNQEICFMPAAPGLSGVLLRRTLMERLSIVKMHPGRLLHYLPAQPIHDPIAGSGCVAIPTAVARTTNCFRMDSQRQINRFTAALAPLNGQLISSDAEALVSIMSKSDRLDSLPREITLELNTKCQSRRIDRPSVDKRSDMSPQVFEALLDELRMAPDTRITIGGSGDPIECDALFDVLACAAERGLKAMHLETDLLCEDAGRIARLAHSPVDIISVHIPAATTSTYAKIMGIDAMTRVLNNVSTLVSERRNGLPLIVPTFVKCRENLAEMEIWYDQWIRALGTAVIVGPSDFAGQINDVSVADMSPSRRGSCRRLKRRLTVLSDGTVVACEQDVHALSPLGRICEQPLTEIWQQSMQPLRLAHACGKWNEVHPLCGRCREWNRP
ncbi:MAG: SPASM domain-containing protein [Phycisphaerae bacterium]|nr:SPASM domain-containing protein [Phycisphaerae bacterium]